MKKKFLLLCAALAATCASQAEVVTYFADDFEWLNAWADLKKVDAIGTNNEAADPQKICTPTIDGVTAIDTLMNRGYNFLRWIPSKEADGKVASGSECIYLCQNYLKFGKSKYQGGIVLPKVDVAEGAKNLTFSFKYTPQRKGTENDGAYDPVNLYVRVINGTDTVTVTNETLCQQPENGAVLTWLNASVDLSSVTVNKNTTLQLLATQWGVATANRWYLDDLKITGEVGTTGVEAVKNEKVAVAYTAGDFTVTAPEGVTAVKVYNVNGQLVASQALTAGENTVNASALAAGLYVMKFNNGAVVKVVK